MWGYTTWIFTPEILDIISPMNESRPRVQPVNTNIFGERYFYLMRTHTCLAITIVPVVYVAGFVVFLTLVQHACGMCKLLGYRAERLFCVIEDKATRDLMIIHKSQINYRNIAAFVRQHYNLIQFVFLFNLLDI
ncbi:PREDICTED: uncharacterized protein LOC105570220 [Vollenhovia emeryi]|uniref:uncharacterized protein LOC105570220 n=1 Tax=Vollenhovia emeryi TaxID=411798 RepID=UPI0005F4A10B|nr:PREDICTED: uncharacterized protein LOC105570220 [Vollenhovia emeryi]